MSLSNRVSKVCRREGLMLRNSSYTMTGGSPSAYSLSAPSFVLADGAMVTFTANQNSGSAATLSVNGTASAPMLNAASSLPIGAGDLVMNGLYRAYYSDSYGSYLVERIVSDAKTTAVAFITTAGNSTSYTLASSGFALYHGAHIKIIPHLTSGSSPTLNVNSTGAIPLVNIAGSAITAGKMTIGTQSQVSYDGSIKSWVVQFLTTSTASSGANSDITSLSGLTTALSLAQGGTGATTASAARTALGAAGTGANGDITSLTTLTAVGSSSGTLSLGTSGNSLLNLAPSGTNGAITLTTGGTGALGACAISSFTASLGSNAKTCANLPAGAPIFCSPASSQGTGTLWSSWASSAGNVTIVMGTAGAASTWQCMWMVP